MPETLAQTVERLIDIFGRSDKEGLRGEIHAERAERREQARRIRRWVTAGMALIVLVGAATVSGAYLLIQRNSHRIEQAERDADRRWCGTLDILVAPSAPTPTTERGRQIAAALARLRSEFDCP